VRRLTQVGGGDGGAVVRLAAEEVLHGLCPAAFPRGRRDWW
jgi:hypothetical protein